MKIGLLSDTHGDLIQTTKALEILKDCDYIIHLGDVLYHGPRNPLPKNYNPKELAEILSYKDNIIYIKGNCDSDVDEMVINNDLSHKNRFIEFQNYKIYATHGYEKTEEERVAKAKILGANFVISGHTHIKVLKKYDDIVIINPGSTSIPKDGQSSIGIIEGNKVYLMDIDNNKVIDTFTLSLL